jgi:hypothetical protein
MDTIATVTEALQALLGPVADRLGQETGFIRRHRRWTGASFVQALVLGWLHAPTASLEALVRMGALRGVTMSAQGLAQRFTERAATFLAAVLAQAVRQVVCAPQAVSIELLQRFTAVWLLDSTVIGLPAALAARWPGTGGAYGSNAAAVKAEVGMDLLSGQLAGPYLLPGRRGARSAARSRVATGQFAGRGFGVFLRAVHGGLGRGRRLLAVPAAP